MDKVITDEFTDRVILRLDGGDLAFQSVLSVWVKRWEAVLSQTFPQLQTKLLPDGGERLVCFERPVSPTHTQWESDCSCTCVWRDVEHMQSPACRVMLTECAYRPAGSWLCSSACPWGPAILRSPLPHCYTRSGAQTPSTPSAQAPTASPETCHGPSKPSTGGRQVVIVRGSNYQKNRN